MLHVVSRNNDHIKTLAAARFKDLHPTTMVMTIDLDGILYVGNAFRLLPITYLDIVGLKRIVKKIDIPPCGVPGAISSIRHRGQIRGLMRSQKFTTFDNCITADIDTSSKPLNVKVYPSLIHICGANKMETNWEVTRYLVDAVCKIQKILDYMRSSPAETEATLRWVIEATRGFGDTVVCPSEEVMLNARIYMPLPITLSPPSSPVEPQTKPINVDIATLLLSQCYEHQYHSKYVAAITYVCSIERICSPDFGVKQTNRVNMIMVNYNINLGLGSINRTILSQLFNCVDGFYSEYCNTVNHSVMISLPYVHDSEEKKKETSCTSFMAHQSSKITISGRNPLIIEDAYYRFMNIIMANIDKIRGDRDLPLKKQRPKTVYGIVRDYWLHKYTTSKHILLPSVKIPGITLLK